MRLQQKEQKNDLNLLRKYFSYGTNIQMGSMKDSQKKRKNIFTNRMKLEYENKAPESSHFYSTSNNQRLNYPKAQRQKISINPIQPDGDSTARQLNNLKESLSSYIPKFKCQMCQKYLFEDQLATLCLCKIQLCKACRKTYLIGQILKSQKILCPTKRCKITLRIGGGELYNSFPEQIKKILDKKDNENQKNVNNKNILTQNRNQNKKKQIKPEQLPKQNKQKEYNSKQSLKKLKKEVIEERKNVHQIELNERDLKIRCPKCLKHCLQRVQYGQINCDCGHNFCSQCLIDWKKQHVCHEMLQKKKKIQKGKLLKQYQKFRCCLCCDELFGKRVASILKYPLKLLLGLLWLGLILILIVLYLWIWVPFLALISLLLGIIASPFIKLGSMYRKGKYLKMGILIILFPILVIIGTYEYFCYFFGKLEGMCPDLSNTVGRWWTYINYF